MNAIDFATTQAKARVLIVSDKNYVRAGEHYYSYGGTQKEFKALSDICNLSILVSVQDRAEVPNGYEALSEGIKVYSNGWIRYWCALPAPWIMARTYLRVVSLQKDHGFDIIVGKAPREVGIGAILGAWTTKTYSIFHYSYDWIPSIPYDRGNLLRLILPCYRAGIWSFRKKALRFACRKAQCIATVSSEFARQLSAISGLQLSDIRFLRTTFTLQDALFNINPIDEGTPPNVLFVGRMDSNKNVETLLKGFGIAKSQGYGGTLQLAGVGPEYERLRRLTHELGIDDHVVFLGYVENDRLPALFERSLVLVLPSFSEGFPKVLLEASAAARPLLGSAIEGNRGIIVPEKNGFLFDPADPQDLADRLVQLADRRMAIKMGLEARAMVDAYRPIKAIESWQAAFAEGLLHRPKDTSKSGGRASRG